MSMGLNRLRSCVNERGTSVCYIYIKNVCPLLVKEYVYDPFRIGEKLTVTKHRLIGGYAVYI